MTKGTIFASARVYFIIVVCEKEQKINLTPIENMAGDEKNARNLGALWQIILFIKVRLVAVSLFGLIFCIICENDRSLCWW